MKEPNYDSTIGACAPFLTAFGNAVAVWGGDMLREAYEDEARKNEIIRKYYRRIDKVESRMDRLTLQHTSGKITEKRYLKRFARYETELKDLHDERSGIDADIEERKKEGLRLIMQGGGLTLESHMLDMLSELFAD